MARKLFYLISLLIILLSVPFADGAEPQAKELAAKKTSAKKPSAKGLELFDKQIKQVLVTQCYKCHSKKGESIEGGLELDSPSGMLRGGDTGPMLVAHQVKKSRLMRMLRHEEGVEGMPPEHKLPDNVIAAFEKWIHLGAPDSRKEIGLTNKEQRLNANKDHWAFQPPKSVKPPSVNLTKWSRDAMIDSFILSRIEAKGMKPAGDANRLTLVRRVYFDLIGLPPSPKEVEAFVSDKSPDALPLLIDRLLGSPQFGERWGRHWLDVVRYAESSGMEFNFTYPHAWPYRDYVIDALNEDKPFDVFLREQIAGDLMPAPEGETSEAELARRIAPSLLAFGPKRHNSSGVQYRMDVVDDQINTVFRATLAMTVSCARCHDHKFDPIPTKDYYALAGIFLSTEPLYGTIKQKYSNNPTDLLPFGPNADALHKVVKNHTKDLGRAERELERKNNALKKATAAEKLASNKKAELEKRVAAKAKAAKTKAAVLTVATVTKSDATVQPVAAIKPDAAPAPLTLQEELDKAVTVLAEAKSRVDTLRKEIGPQKTKIAELKKIHPPRPQYAMSARDRSKRADTKIAIRGEIGNRGEVVPRGYLSAVRVANAPKINIRRSGRLELAEWITSANNPLTARVRVNRIWHHLFGRGLVSTVDNFGVIGKRPSHPQLLDTLALRFKREGWSVKRMIRAIMLSRTYQLSCTPIAQNMAIDPGNRLLWRATPRRLEAEIIRDSILAVSGQLNVDRPYGSTVTQLGDKLVRGIPTEKIQPANTHRSVYLPIVRDYVPELFDQFDFPSPSLVSGRRSVTNVPTQALYLRNSKFVINQTRHAARRLLASKNATTDSQRADLAMRWALARSPSDIERHDALQLVELARQADPKGADRDVNAWAAWFQTLFTTAEFRYLVEIN